MSIENKIDELIKITSKEKIKNIENFLKDKNPKNVKPTIIQEECKLTSTQTDKIKNICKECSDGNLLSLLISTKHKLQNKDSKIETKLVMTGDFIHKNVDYTNETVHQMIERAKHEIYIIGYWVYNLDRLFERLEELSNSCKIIFILNHENFEEHKDEIYRNWRNYLKPIIYKINLKKSKNTSIDKLHSKIIIIDNNEILITSANLTKNAMENNIESGIWTNDKSIVNSCKEIFSNWIDEGIFIEVKSKNG